MFFNAYKKLMRRPSLLLGVLIGLAIYLASHIPQLQIDASSDTLVLEGDQALEVYRKVYQEYGTSSFLFVTFRPNDDIFSKQVIKQVQHLKQDLEVLAGVGSVVTYLDVPLLQSPPVSLANFNEAVNYLDSENTDIQLAREEFRTSPIYRDLLTNQAQTVTALQVNLVLDKQLDSLRTQRQTLLQLSDRSIDQEQELQSINTLYEIEREKRKALEKQVVADVREVLAGYRAQGNAIFLGGLPMIVSDMLDYVRNDMVVFGSAVIVFIVLLLSIIFRSPRWVALSLLTCFITCVYMLGGIAFLGLKLTVISANFVALLLILTLAITIHLIVRCIEYERSHPSLDQFALVMKTMRTMIKPCAYSAATTMAAFISLMVSGVKPVMDFGWTMAIAVTVGLLVSFLFLPAGLLLFPRNKKVRKSPISGQFTAAFARLIEHRGTWISGVSLFVFLLSLWGMAQLKVENRFIDYFDKNTEIYQGMLEIDAELGGTLPLDIVITHRSDQPSHFNIEAASEDVVDDDFFTDEGGDDFFSQDAGAYAQSYWFSRQGMEELAAVHHYVESLENAGKVLSLATLYAVLNQVVDGNIDDVQLAIIQSNLSADIDKALVKPYLSADGTQARIALRVKETSKSLSRNAMLQTIDAYLQEQGYEKADYQLTGMMVLYNNMLQSLFRSQAATLGLVFLAIWLMMGVLFRSMYVSLLALLPNVLAAFFVLGAMGWLGIPLDVMTITIASITIGIGVDDTIHYIHRYKKELAKDGDYMSAMYRSHASIGLAMFYTSVTIVVGFGILTLSNFTPSIYFGFLTAVAMVTALLGALILLPHLLCRLKPAQLKSH